MANKDRPNGFKAVGTLSGAPIAGTIRSYIADGTGSDIFPGDVVIITASGRIDVAGATSTGIVGICAGFVNAQSGQTSGVSDHFMSGAADVDRQKTYYNASADGERWILVHQGTDVVYEVQNAGIIGVTSIGNNADIIATAGDTTRGISQQELSATTATGTAQFRIIDAVNRIDNDVSTANSRWLVTINESHYTNRVGV